ncbi:MAG: DUF362 domain-containing protein [Candidatus Thermoplasmatota archaeon]|nr:DUF362 domain-containing protein [Candidatus Thermoplasmatota archaeon]
MKKVIFFTDINNLHEALEYFPLKAFENKEVPVKLHMGEVKNKYFPKPDLAKRIVDELKEVKSSPYLFDTTVAYRGLRGSKTGYEKVAKIHGFTKNKIGCKVVIDDSGVPVKIDNRTYYVGKHLNDSTHIFALSHVKGHVASGMGGAIKNFGMGGVTRETKRNIHHGSRPVYNKDKCTFCGVCSELCPFDAIKLDGEEWVRKKKACFGCGVCVEMCKSGALSYEDADFQYLLACAAKACLQDKNVVYLNEAKRISKSCDCDPFSDPIICPDVGYLLSDDPVAIDKASIDLINNVKPDVFKKVNKVDPEKQIRYGEEIGLGVSEYSLIEL